MFDAENFMSTQVEGENSTVTLPVPEDEYQALATKTDIRNGEKEGKEWAILDVTWQIDDPAVAEVTGRDVNTVRQSVFLDLTESGNLDMGKGRNVQLGKLREALGQNGPGAWSPSMIEGQAARVKVSHRLYEGNTYAEIKQVTSLS